MDTIFALASGAGKAGVAVVRLSGPDAWTVTERLSGALPPVRCMALRRIRNGAGEVLDTALVVAFEADASFTGERVCEWHLHGSVAVVQAVLGVLSEQPECRMALPGEFTRRAFDMGRLDLTQVEALADLIEAETESQRRQASEVLSGALSDKVRRWRAALVRSLALIEASIDFADEEVPEDVTQEVLGLLAPVCTALQAELDGAGAAERLRAGFEVAIVGPPNAGKSTLLNYLAGRDAAITSEIAGTTRDVIEVRFDLRGLAVTLLDTAGLRETQDPVERMGVDRARARAEAADVRVHLAASDADLLMPVADTDIVLRPKDDDGEAADGVSGHTGAGVARCLDTLYRVLSDRVASASLSSHMRHREALQRGAAGLLAVVAGLESGEGDVDLISEDLRATLRVCESLIGTVDVEHVLDEIFASFCLGK
jgi:tRNA modification GTPase